MRKIPLVKPDLPSLKEIESSFGEVLDTGKVTNFGRYVSQFEQEAGEYLGTHVTTVSSGTIGLVFCLLAAGLRRGDAVVLPSFTFMATAQAVLFAGGVPVFAEVADDFTLSIADLEEVLARRSARFVVPVHTYGLPCSVQEIESVVDKAGRRRSEPITVLYDAAHAFGSAADGKRVGGFGKGEVFSLSVTKVLVSIEGGMVSSHDGELVDRVRKYRNYGIEKIYEASWMGLNGKMSELHAIVGLYNLRRLGHLVSERQRKARYYIQRLQASTNFITPIWPDEVIQTFKDFTVLVPEEVADRRGRIIEHLNGAGIETRTYFDPPVHEQPYFQRYVDRPLPLTEGLARRVIALPFYTTLEKAEMDYVVDTLAEAQEKFF